MVSIDVNQKQYQPPSEFIEAEIMKYGEKQTVEATVTFFEETNLYPVTIKKDLW
jgi:hypothetical protein